MSRRLQLAALAIAAVASLALAGCSAGAESGKKLDATKSPLSEYMSAAYGGFDEKSFAKQQLQVEELVATCMSKEGFEYLPNDQSQGSMMMTDDEDRDTEEWVAANGYGFIQSPEQIEKQTAESENYVDPNQPYVEKLSETERTAYYATLYGQPPAEDELGEDGSYEYNWENSGCQGSAQHEVQGEQAYDDETYKPLFEAMGTLYEKLATLPAIVKLDAEWASCMADAGYGSLKSKQEATQVISEKQNKLYEDSSANGGDGMPDPAAQEKLRGEEIDMALADFACSKKLDYQNIALTAQFDLEKAFITEHQAELDALVADYEQGAGKK